MAAGVKEFLNSIKLEKYEEQLNTVIDSLNDLNGSNDQEILRCLDDIGMKPIPRKKLLKKYKEWYEQQPSTKPHFSSDVPGFLKNIKLQQYKDKLTQELDTLDDLDSLEDQEIYDVLEGIGMKRIQRQKFIREYKLWVLRNIPSEPIKPKHDAKNTNEQKTVEDQSESEDDEDVVLEYHMYNPLMINIGVSTYQHERMPDLAGCGRDTQTMLQLFINEYNWDLNLSLHSDDESELGLTKAQILSKIEKGRDIMVEDQKDNTMDGIIITYSGHGGSYALYGADYDPIKDIEGKECGKIGIAEIQTLFTAERFHLVPKIIIVDACRGDKGAGVGPAKGGPTEKKKTPDKPKYRHEMGNWMILYSNPDGYASFDSSSGGFLIRSVRETLKKPICYGDHKKSKQMHMGDIAYKVRRTAMRLTKSKKRNTAKQVLTVEDNLTERVYLHKGKCSAKYIPNIKYETEEVMKDELQHKGPIMEGLREAAEEIVDAVKTVIGGKKEPSNAQD